MKTRDLLWASLTVTGGVLCGGLALLVLAYGLDLFSFPALWWRDHPFDFGNILHAANTFSLSSRLWAYDPLHLFGWTPHAFYNPLATLLGSLCVSAGGMTEGAYRVWLLLVLLATPLAFLPLLPRVSSRAAWVLGGLSAAWLSLLIYPRDVGILDANPVQILYTGQWAQRLGIALGILSIERFYRALESLESNWRNGAHRMLAAAFLLGASVFCHYMSGYATAAVAALLCIHYLLARRLTGGGWPFRSLLALPVVLVAAGLLFLDFACAFLSASGTHHFLPLLLWEVPQGALLTVREVIVPALPFLLIPLATALLSSDRSRPALSGALLPLVVLFCIFLATPASLLGWFLVVMTASLAATRLEGKFLPRHWLPVAAFFLLLLSCAPDSLRVFGLDLSGLVPFSGSIGWAKLAGFSRFLFLAWLGVLVVDGLAPDPGRRRATGRLVTLGLILLGLLVPLILSTSGGKEKTGAQSFFARINDTDRQAVEMLQQRLRGVAARTPEDGYLLVEDTLHHPDGSALQNRGIPNGHLPYLAGVSSHRPVLGGSVTTRLITHPLAHTSRGQLLCQDFSTLELNPAPVLDRLRALGVSDILAHSPEFVRMLQRYPAALEVDTQAGLTHFALEHYRPILTDPEGLHLAGGRIKWRPDGPEIELPAGTAAARLRQVHYPTLSCTAEGSGGPRNCTLSAWTEGPRSYSGCLVDDPRSIEVEIPWIQLQIEPEPAGPVSVRIHSRPSLVPFVIMLLCWAAALIWRFGPFFLKACANPMRLFRVGKS